MKTPIYALILLILLAGCSDMPRVYWPSIEENLKKANENAPKRTYCTRVGDQIFCQTQ